MCDFEKVNKILPSKNNFYSSLSDKGISDKEYEHVLKVWNKFEITILVINLGTASWPKYDLKAC